MESSRLAALRHRPLGRGDRVVVFAAEEFLEEHLRAIFPE